MVQMLQKCPQCGAEFLADEQCRDRFDLCLALEFENPTTFGAVHHLTVACYMLQHNVYSREVWLEARNMVAQFIRAGVAPAEMRRRNRSRFNSGRRAWSVTKGPKLAEFETIAWSRTIASVRPENPETYCAGVTLWATSILADTGPLMLALNIEP
jgi:hypothetical protein